MSVDYMHVSGNVMKLRKIIRNTNTIAFLYFCFADVPIKSICLHIILNNISTSHDNLRSSISLYQNLKLSIVLVIKNDFHHIIPRLFLEIFLLFRLI